MYCQVCGYVLEDADKFCTKCGSAVSADASGFIITTTPSIQGYRIKKMLGVVTGLTPRTRGVLGRFIAGIESMIGGEVTAYTTELEKARMEAVERVKTKARAIGANAIVGLDLETSNLGKEGSIIMISATGTAVVIESERKKRS